MRRKGKFVTAEVFGRMLLISGPETLLADRAVAQVRRQVTESVPDVLINDVEGGDVDAGRFAEMTGGSLFSQHSLVIIRDVGALGSPVDDSLLTLAQDMPADLTVVMVHGGGQKGRGLLTKLKKAKVETVDCPTVKPWEMPQWVAAEARRIGAKIDARAAESLVQAVGHDLRSLAGAVAQLHADGEGKPISETLVKQYFGGRAEVTSFNVADDVLAGRGGAALEKLRWALETGVAPVLITSALANSLRGLGKYHHHRNSGLRQGELAAAVGVPPFKLKDLARQVKDWPPARVADGIVLVASADADIKGAAGSAEFTLEHLVIRLVRHDG